MRREGNYRWIALWGLPLRVTHWIVALLILVLALTGLYIGEPFVVTSGDTADHFLMGRARFVHFAAGSVLVMMAIIRVYWLFTGNRFERWHALFPVSRKAIRDMVRQAWAYLVVKPERAPRYLGHNPLQQASYTMLYGVGLLQIVTGFALYGQSNPAGIIYGAFNWIGPALGGMPNVRFLHHALTWVFATYVPIHVYLSLRADVLKHDSTISSMVTGGRMVSADEVFEDD
jgi:Ni/Fe-hydrogenase b-type cytochrome subunit